MDYTDIQIRLIRLNRSQKYLSKIFRKPESYISYALRGKRYLALREKILIHLDKLEETRNLKIKFNKQ